MGLDTDNMYETPFWFLVGPEQHVTMVHKEKLCAKSPFMSHLCQQASSTNKEHEIVAELHNRLSDATEGPAANLIDEVCLSVWKSNMLTQQMQMIAILRVTLQSVSNDLFRQLKVDIQASIDKNCKGPRAGSLDPPRDGSYTDWVCMKLRSFKPIQVSKVIQSAQSTLFRAIRQDERSEDPSLMVRYNKLPLPNSTKAAARAVQVYIYDQRLPEPRCGDNESMLTLCHVNALAGYLQLFELANHCMGLLICVPELLLDPPLAKTLVAQAQLHGNKSTWMRIRRLLIDILASADTLKLNVDQESGLMDIISALDVVSLKYMAVQSAQRNMCLAKSRAQAGSRPPSPNLLPQDAADSEAKALPVKQEQQPPPDKDVPAYPAPYLDPIASCKRYHQHAPGEGCFPESKRSEAVIRERSETASQPTSRAPSVPSSAETDVAGVSRKRKREAVIEEAAEVQGDEGSSE